MTSLNRIKTVLLAIVLLSTSAVFINDVDTAVRGKPNQPTREGEEYPIIEEGMVLRTTDTEKINRSLLPIPKGATVISSTVTFSNEPVSGTTTEYGQNVWVNIAGGEKEYEYPEEGLGYLGSWGNTYRMTDGATFKDVYFSGDNGKMRVILPKNATVTEAVFNITAFQRDEEIMEMNISNNVGQSRFGYNIKNLGDQNGDGRDELVVAAPFASSETGTIYEVYENSISPGSLVIGATKSAQQSGAHFGMAISDVFQYPDTSRNAIAVGAPNDGLGREGSVRILSYPGFLTESSRILGNSSDEKFGSAVAIGDIDMDAEDELIVGAPDALSGRGAVYLFDITSRDHELITVINGSSTSTGFGRDIVIGKMNMDGRPDLAISSDDEIFLYLGNTFLDLVPDATFDPKSDASSSEFGPMDMFAPPGTSTGTLAVGVPTSTSGSVLLYDGATIDSVLDATITPPSSIPGFGSSVSGGDITGDRNMEIVVGAPGTDSVQGQVHIFKRSSGLWKTLPVKGNSDDRFGYSVEICDIRDLNDPYPDIVVGAPEFFGSSETGPGRIYVYDYFDLDSLPNNRPSLEVGTNTGWTSDQNKVSGQFFTGDISNTINNYLDSTTEDFNNKHEGFVYVDISFISGTTSSIEGSNHFNITDFRILFDSTIVEEDLNTAMNRFLENAQGDDLQEIDGQIFVMVPFVFSSQTPGAVRLETIDVEYDAIPFIEERPENVHMDEDSIEEELIDLYKVFGDDITGDPYLNFSARTTGQNMSKANVSIKNFRYLSVDLTVGTDENGDGERDNANWSGQLEVIIDVEDGSGGLYTTSDPLVIHVDEVNDAPAITDTPTTLAVQNELFSYTPNAVDDEGDAINFTIDMENSPANMTVDQEFGTVTWRPGPWDVGSVNWTFVLTDGMDERRYTFRLDVEDVEDPPMFITPPPVVDEGVLVGERFEYDFIAIDPDIGDRITYILVFPVQGAVIDINTGRFSYTPPQHFLEPVEFTVRARDSDGLSSDLEFTLNTTFIDTAPVLNNTPELTLYDQVLWTYDLVVYDAEEHRIEMSIFEKPEGMEFDIVTQRLTWMPGVDQLGDFNLSILVASTNFELFFNYTLEVLRSSRTWNFTLEGIEDGKTVKGNIQIGGQLEVSPSTIERVEIKIGDNNWTEGIVQSGRWSIDIDTSRYDDGEYTIQIRGYDGALYSDTKTLVLNFENEEEKTSPLIFILIGIAIVMIIALIAGGFLLYRKISAEKEQKEIQERQAEAIQASKRSMDDFLKETGGNLSSDVDYSELELEEEIEGENMEKIDEIFQPLNIPKEEVDVEVEVPEDPLQSADVSTGPVLGEYLETQRIDEQVVEPDLKEPPAPPEE